MTVDKQNVAGMAVVSHRNILSVWVDSGNRLPRHEPSTGCSYNNAHFHTDLVAKMKPDFSSSTSKENFLVMVFRCDKW